MAAHKKKWTPFSYAIYLTAYENKLASFLSNPKQYLKKHPLPVMKDCKPAILYKLNFNTEALVIKRFKFRGFFHWLTHVFKKTRAENCWHAAELFEKYGIKTAKPIALYVRHFLGIHFQSYYVCQFIEGPTLADYIAQTKHYDLIDHAVSIIENMHDNQITHGDLKATNFIVHDHEVVFVDLDVARSHIVQNRERRERDIRRFLKNWRDNPDIMKRESIRRLQNKLT